MKNNVKGSSKGSIIFWVAVSLAFLLLAVAVCAAMTEGFTNGNPYGWFDTESDITPDATAPAEEPVDDGSSYVGATVNRLYFKPDYSDLQLASRLFEFFISDDDSIHRGWKVDSFKVLEFENGSYLYFLFYETTNSFSLCFENEETVIWKYQYGSRPVRKTFPFVFSESQVVSSVLHYSLWEDIFYLT